MADVARNLPYTWFETTADGFVVGARHRSWMGWWCGFVVLLGSVFLIYSASREILIFLPVWLGVGGTQAALMVFGKTEFARRGNRLTCFVGIGRIGRSWSIPWKSFAGARDGPTQAFGFPSNFGDITYLERRRERSRKFGRLLAFERRAFLIDTLERMRTGAEPRRARSRTRTPEVESAPAMAGTSLERTSGGFTAVVSFRGLLSWGLTLFGLVWAAGAVFLLSRPEAMEFVTVNRPVLCAAVIVLGVLYSLIAALGDVRVTGDDDGVRVSTGWGPFRLTRRLPWGQVHLLMPFWIVPRPRRRWLVELLVAEQDGVVRSHT